MTAVSDPGVIPEVLAGLGIGALNPEVDAEAEARRLGSGGGAEAADSDADAAVISRDLDRIDSFWSVR